MADRETSVRLRPATPPDVEYIVITEKGRGYGRAAIREIKRLAFGEPGAHRLWLDVKLGNDRARRLYESEGFVLEGILRDCLRGEAGYESLAVLSLLEHEHRSRLDPRIEDQALRERRGASGHGGG